jgi:hypothetical protein
MQKQNCWTSRFLCGTCRIKEVGHQFTDHVYVVSEAVRTSPLAASRLGGLADSQGGICGGQIGTEAGFSLPVAPAVLYMHLSPVTGTVGPLGRVEGIWQSRSLILTDFL